MNLWPLALPAIICGMLLGCYLSERNRRRRLKSLADSQTHCAQCGYDKLLHYSREGRVSGFAPACRQYQAVA